MFPPSFTTRAISVAKRIGAPSRRPPARPIVQAFSRSRIASLEVLDDCCESCVRRDFAIVETQSANVTNNKTAALVTLGRGAQDRITHVIVIPFNKSCARHERK